MAKGGERSAKRDKTAQREAITSNGRNYERFEKLVYKQANGTSFSKLTRAAPDNDIASPIRDSGPPPSARYTPIYTPSFAQL